MTKIETLDGEEVFITYHKEFGTVFLFDCIDRTSDQYMQFAVRVEELKNTIRMLEEQGN